jgi:hypothetical protein
MTKVVKSWWFALMLLPWTNLASANIDPILALTEKDIYDHDEAG